MYGKKDCNKIIDILEYYNGKEVDCEIADVIVKIAECKKDSYIRDLNGLLSDKRASNNERCIYLFLASKRNHLDYLIEGIDWLPINLVSVDTNKLKHNSLIELDNNYIYFKY